VVYRRYLLPEHRSHVSDFAVYIKVQDTKGDFDYRAISRQLVPFCAERPKGVAGAFSPRGACGVSSESSQYLHHLRNQQTR